MKFTINTETLKTMVAKAVKGASNNKMLALTQLMNIELKDNKLTLTTTDATNYLYVHEDKVAGEDFKVVVPVEVFSKLVAKTTSENITLELKENCLEFKGNGKFNIELVLDENGNYIDYPNPLNDMDTSVPKDLVELTTLKTILQSVKPSIAKTTEVPVYCNYYCGDRVVGTDTYVVAALDVNLFDEPTLITPEMMDLFNVFTEEKIGYFRDDNKVAFVTKDVTLYGTLADDIEDFAIDAIEGLVEQEFNSDCAVSKTDLLNTLDRIGLFIGVYDKGAINLTFTSEGLMISSTSSSGVETLDYKESNNFLEFTASIDCEMLKNAVKAVDNDLVVINYGEDNAIMIVDNNVAQVVALLEED